MICKSFFIYLKMGIKSINELLKEHTPSAFEKVKLRNFSNSSIAIDSNLYFNASICASYKHIILSMIDPLEDVNIDDVINHCLMQLINFINKLILLKINIIWIWDGVSNIQKISCKEKRKKLKVDYLNKLNEKKDELKALNPLFRTSEKIKEYKLLLSNKNIITTEILNYFKNILELLGFPSIKAISEGEKLCANLSNENLISGVWSRDTDNYILGTKILITGFNGYDEDGDIMIDIVNIPNILKELNKSKEWLLDLCIMLGCDFNTNIPTVGTKKCWNLMNSFNSIEEILANNVKFKSECLNYISCREIFNTEPTNYSTESEELKFKINNFNSNITLFIEQYNIPINIYNLLMKGVSFIQ